VPGVPGVRPVAGGGWVVGVYGWRYLVGWWWGYG
jgi:hypothetical protein